MAKVTLVLARGPGQPDGCVKDRIDLSVCLTPLGRIDERAFAAAPEPWLVVRSRPGEPTRQAWLDRTEAGWALRGAQGDDAPVRTLDLGIVRPGEIAVLGEPDGSRLLYRVVAVEQD